MLSVPKSTRGNVLISPPIKTFNGCSVASLAQAKPTTCLQVMLAFILLAVAKAGGYLIFSGYAEGDRNATNPVDVRSIYHRGSSYSVLQSDDSVSTWGAVAAPVAMPVIYRMNIAFAAHEADGKVSFWGFTGVNQRVATYARGQSRKIISQLKTPMGTRSTSASRVHGQLARRAAISMKGSVRCAKIIPAERVRNGCATTAEQRNNYVRIVAMISSLVKQGCLQKPF